MSARGTGRHLVGGMRVREELKPPARGSIGREGRSSRGTDHLPLGDQRSSLGNPPPGRALVGENPNNLRRPRQTPAVRAKCMDGGEMRFAEEPKSPPTTFGEQPTATEPSRDWVGSLGGMHGPWRRRCPFGVLMQGEGRGRIIHAES